MQYVRFFFLSLKHTNTHNSDKNVDSPNLIDTLKTINHWNFDQINFFCWNLIELFLYFIDWTIQIFQIWAMTITHHYWSQISSSKWIFDNRQKSYFLNVNHWNKFEIDSVYWHSMINRFLKQYRKKRISYRIAAILWNAMNNYWRSYCYFELVVCAICFNDSFDFSIIRIR